MVLMVALKIPIRRLKFGFDSNRLARRPDRSLNQFLCFVSTDIRRLGNNIIICVKNETAHLVKINNGLSVSAISLQLLMVPKD